MRHIVALFASLVLAGCVTQHGTPITQDQIAQIKQGATTKTDLLSLLGRPISSAQNSDGTEVVTWSYARVAPGVYENQAITVILAADGTVASYTVSNIGSPYR